VAEDRDAQGKAVDDGVVDLARRGVALVEELEDLERDRRLDAVRDVPRDELLEHDRHLPHAGDQRAHAFDERRIGPGAGHDVDEVDEVGRRVPMRDQRLPLPTRRDQREDVEIARVRRQDRVVAKERVDLLEERPLRLRQLGDRLDHHLGAAHRLLEAGAAAHRRPELFRRPRAVDLAGLAQRRECRGHQRGRLGERLGLAVGEAHRMAAEREHERDAVPHDAGAEDRDLAHACLRLARAGVMDNARPPRKPERRRCLGHASSSSRSRRPELCGRQVEGRGTPNDSYLFF